MTAAAANLTSARAMSEAVSFGWEQWNGQAVVVDTSSTYVVLGVLRGQSGRCLLLEDADVHDLRDTQTNREHYVVHARRHGIRANRKQVLVRLEEVVAVSRLADVLAD
jgi:hypothetical protein